MKPTILLLWFQLLAAPLLADDVGINIGGTPITIPTPPGFIPVTADMTMLNQFFENFVAPQNKRFATFISEEYLPAIRRGEVPQMARTLSVQTAKTTVDRTITKSDFAKLKDTMQKQNAELMRKVEKEMPGMMEKINSKIEGQFDAKLDLSLAGIIPLPPHESSDRSLAFSMLVNYAMKTPDGTTTNISGPVTATFLHARGKLLFIYVNGAEKELEWTRTTAKAWATAILAANPSDAATAAKESARSGFDWNRVWRSALIGAAVGGLIGLVRMFMKRKDG